MDPDALARIGDALAAQPDRQRALELLLTEARRLTRAEAGTVYLREGDRLRFAAVQNDVLARRFGTDEARRRLAAEPLALVEPSGGSSRARCEPARRRRRGACSVTPSRGGSPHPARSGDTGGGRARSRACGAGAPGRRARSGPGRYASAPRRHGATARA